MEYNIVAAGFTLKGPSRRKNEDNFLCGGFFLPDLHVDAEFSAASFSTAESNWIAVFDGVGGEVRGETASFLAARALAGHGAASGFGHDPDPVFVSDPAEITARMNSAICAYAEKMQVRVMGSTVAALCFCGRSVNGFNVGDSRCYRLSEGRLERLSTDHAVYAGHPPQRLLTQYLGIPEKEYIITPACFQGECREGDLYLLCTDGISDVIIDRKLKDLMAADTSLQDKLQEIRDRLERNGTPDNATAVLVSVDSVLEKQAR